MSRDIEFTDSGFETVQGRYMYIVLKNYATFILQYLREIEASELGKTNNVNKYLLIY